MKRIMMIGVFVLMVGQAYAATSPYDILVYDNDTNFHRSQAAVASLGWTCTVANAGSFNTLLTSGSWDCVVMDCPNYGPTEGWAPFINYIAGGGRAVMSFWDLDNDGGGGDPGLPPAFGVAVTQTFWDPQPVYRWDYTNPIFNVPNYVMDLTGLNDSGWIDNGDELAPAGAVPVAGFSMMQDMSRCAILIGNSGRTIYNGFLFDDINDPMATALIANEIYNVTPEPATLCLLGAGAVGMLLRKRRK